MKVEIEIKKKDLRNIFCAAIRNYYREINLSLEPNSHARQRNSYDEYIIENLWVIRYACNAIANLCNLIEELDTVEPNDASGVICFDDSEEEQEHPVKIDVCH